jgi:hypothetical protein
MKPNLIIFWDKITQRPISLILVWKISILVEILSPDEKYFMQSGE